MTAIYVSLHLCKLAGNVFRGQVKNNILLIANKSYYDYIAKIGGRI
jgi:hypothetical protein